MWLKLETGILLMLLLFSVLGEREEEEGNNQKGKRGIKITEGEEQVRRVRKRVRRDEKKGDINK